MTKLAAILLMALTVLGCNVPGDDPLTGTSWILTASPDMTIEFAAETNTVSGWTGCNSVDGNYRISTSLIAFDNLRWTEAGCPTDQAFQAESEFLRTLPRIHTWSIHESTLTLSTRQGDTLTLQNIE